MTSDTDKVVIFFYDNRDRSPEIRGALAQALTQDLEAVTKMSMERGRGPAECEFL